ncbi:MAG TPA: hypothetical protein VMS73_07855 [Anaerolineaceae bacterium]|nr:hypothetical protein [Anaerolineaceae bacterium]
MNMQHRRWSLIFIIGLIVMTMGCALATATATPSPTPQSAFPATLLASGGSATPTPIPAEQTATALVAAVETLASAHTTTLTPGLPVTGSTGETGGSNGGTGGSNGGTGGSNGGTGGSNGGTGGSNGGVQGSSSATPTQPSIPFTGPYVVKQIETLGGEVISGVVCSLTQPFSVLSVTPHVTFTFYFAPQDPAKGKVTYKYSIPSAGEAHDAAGTYSLSPVGTDGTLQLSLVVSDHVVFKGFDGNIPNRYKFNLVPSGATSCP